MNYRLYPFIMVIIILSACTAPATQSPATPTIAPQPSPTENPNTAIVLDMVAKLNTGDVEGSLACFAEDARTYFVGMPPTGMEFYDSREALRPTWEFCVNDHFRWEVNVESAEGNVIVAHSKTWLDFTTQLGVAPNDFLEVFVVEDGKIILYSSTMTEQALTEFRPALAEVMPPEPTPDLSAVVPGEELTVTFTGGTCTFAGSLVLKAGELQVNWVVNDMDKEKYALALFTLDDGKDLIDLMSSTIHSNPPAWSDMVFIKEINPGGRDSRAITVNPGKIYGVCFSKPPDLAIGNFGPLVVKP